MRFRADDGHLRIANADGELNVLNMEAEMNVVYNVGSSGVGGGATSWIELRGKPFERIGDNLTVNDGTLSVDVSTYIEDDNTKPITAAAVYAEVGNISALLALI